MAKGKKYNDDIKISIHAPRVGSDTKNYDWVGRRKRKGEEMIADEKVYLSRMKKSMTREEKLFFLDYLNMQDFDAVVDYGGADGTLLSIVKDFVRPDCELYCIDEYAYSIANHNYSIANYNYSITVNRITYGDEAQAMSWTIGKKYLLIFSSVLHEMVAFPALGLILGAQAVAIRDMYFDKLLVDEPHRKEIEGIKAQLKNAYSTYETPTLADAYQLLLKYTYEENYKKESVEDYFCNLAKNLIDRLFVWQKTFKCLCHQTYILPYIKKRVKKDFRIEMKYPTHLKSLWVRKAK